MPDVEREGDGTRSRYVIRTPDGDADLTVLIAAPDRVVADHTFVPEALRGVGLAERLLDALFADAREQGFRIVPACAFVAGQARRHPEWAELFTA
ncbi:GNAT family N-acetyltransferase [Rubellimicrobium aerolatum]|uniref:GNAT family N-acetyltransferase n=1 Tax=Rubellimicrobium aerolatum TaxID=490979 RepID=A0ABW0SFL3_9RHOB|nr:GNAT family N-acetyltransferase [Rubellimicrobium aerolatum]MBP1807145.1 putative GNAT family acetyltransferase [Rubellimicrobium aerolatum]